jgi:VWFA-related protein
MRTSVLAAALALLSGWSGGAQQPVFRTGVELVRVELSVTRDGRPVGGLGAADFEVRDNGVVQTIDHVIVEQVPLDVYFVLDMSQSVSGAKLAALRQAGRRFLDGLTADDRAALIVFSHQVALVEPLTSDLRRVGDTLEHIEGTGSTALRDALYSALCLHTDASRRAVAVVFSDGVDNASWLTEDDVVEATRRSSVVVYAVQAPNVRTGNQADDDRFLKEVVKAAGGRTWRAGTDRDLSDTFVQVLRHIRSRYLLTYYPQGVDGEGWHTLEVKLTHARGDVLARPGYFRTR